MSNIYGVANKKIPEIDAALSNLGNDVSVFDEFPADPTNGRRFYIRTEKFMLAGAKDSGLSEEVKILCNKAVTKQFNIHKDNDLPRFTGDQPLFSGQDHLIMDRKIDRWGDGKTLVPHIFDSSYIAHGLVSYTLSYAKASGKPEDILFVNQFAKWLVYAQLHIHKGFRLKFGEFYSRLFMQWTWLLIAFSDSDIIEQNTRDQLNKLAQSQIVWLDSLKANGSLESIGWNEDQQVMYLDHAESLSRNSPTIWVYFQILNNYRYMRIRKTSFGKNNPVVESLIKKQNATTRTIINNSGMSLTNFKARSYDINSKTLEKLPPNYPAAEFGLLLKTKEEFNHLMKNLNAEWSPFKAFDPYTVLMWDRVTGNIIPDSSGKEIIKGNIVKIENALSDIKFQLAKL